MKTLVARFLFLMVLAAVAAMARAIPTSVLALQLSEIRLKEIKVLTPQVIVGRSFDYNVVLKSINLDDPVTVQVGIFKGDEPVGASWSVKIEFGRDALKVPDRKTAPTSPGVYTLRAWKSMPDGSIDRQESVLNVLQAGGGLPVPLAEYLPISRVAVAVRTQAEADATPLARSTSPGCPTPGAIKPARQDLYYALGLDGLNADDGYQLHFAVYGPLPSKGTAATLVRRREWTETFPTKTDSMAGRVPVNLPSGSYLLQVFRKDKTENALAVGFKVP